jgi:hypothetical protein
MRYLIWISLLTLLCGSCSAAYSPSIPAFDLSLSATIGPTQFQGTLAAINTQTAEREASTRPIAPSPSPTPAVEPAPALATAPSATPPAIMATAPLSSQTPTPDFSLTAGWAGYLSFETSQAFSPTPPFSLDSLQGTPILASYSVKQPLLLYFSGEGSMGSIFDPFRLDVVTPRLYLYSDGLFLVGDEKGQILQKQLSQSDISALLAKLRQLGFYQLQTNGQADQSDPLYHFGPGQYQQVSDASFTEIKTFGATPKEISIYEPLLPYIVQPLKNILAYLNNYRPAGLSPYQPDRLLAEVMPGRNPDLTDQLASLSWPATLPAPDEVSANGFLYLQGQPAATLYSLIGNHEYGVFTYNGDEYTVDAIAPIFPHECQNRAIAPASASLPAYQQNFICMKPNS